MSRAVLEFQFIHLPIHSDDYRLYHGVRIAAGGVKKEGVAAYYTPPALSITPVHLNQQDVSFAYTAPP